MRRALIAILIICLLLTSGCAGNNSGAVLDKVTSVKDLAVASAEQAYAVEEISFPKQIWFSDSNIVKSDESIYLLGNFLEESFLYKLEADASSAQLIASSDDGNEFWCSYCADGNMIYVYDIVNNCLIKYNNQGKRLCCITMPEDVTFDKITAAKGKIYTLGSGKLNCLKINGDKAEVDYALKVSDKASFCVNDEQEVIVAWQNDDGPAISILDETNKSWRETHALDAVGTIVGTGAEWEVYLMIGTAIYGYDYKSASIKKLVSLSDIGVLGNGKICELESGKYLYTGTFKNEAEKPIILKPVSLTEDRISLTLATLSQLHPAIGKAVLKWNQSHPDITIEVRDYSGYNNAADARGGEYRLIADIAEGNAPDIFNLSDFGTMMNASLLARKGLLEDLYPFIEQDNELSQDDFFSGALKSLEVNKKLCQITPGFLLLTATASAKELGENKNYSYGELEKIVTKNDNYQYLFDQAYTRDDWLELMVTASGDRLVDWASAQCHFNSEYFIQLLDMASLRSTEPTNPGGNVVKLVQNSNSLLYMQTFRDVWEAGTVADMYGKDNYAFVGLPEIGHVMVPELSIGMSSQSAHKEQCWQFMREFLLKDCSYVSGIPLRRDGAEKQMLDELEAMKEYPVEYPGRAEAMKDFLAVLENVSTLYQSDAPLWRIISDEVNKFYDGLATAAETAVAIQSRASIYLSEQQ